MKLVKVLQTQGIASRKGGSILIRAGEVAVAGVTCTDAEAEFEPTGLEFTVAGRAHDYREKAYLVLNKPADYECSRTPRHHPSVFALLPPELIERGVQPVGRLDQDTTGLLLMSDDGQFIHRMISPRHKVPKVYHAECAEALSDAQLDALVGGVVLSDEPMPVAAVSAQRLAEKMLELVLTEGKYHQVKRMLAAVGNHVVRLHRASIGTLELGDLEPGQWRWLDADDLVCLDSSARPGCAV